MSRKNNAGILLKSFVVGPLAVNSYLLADPATKDACLIDPGADADKIKNAISEDGLNLKFIINTHGHGDHIGANKNFNVPIYIHKLDKDFLADTAKNMSKFFLFKVKSPEASRLLEDGDTIDVGSIKLEVLHTPGHTPGSISLKTDGIVFTGDTLFNGSVGRTDFDYGDQKALFDSIKAKLLVLPDDTIIYPGHGAPSTIGEERRSNPFL